MGSFFRFTKRCCKGTIGGVRGLYVRYQEWWGTARSSLLVHRRMKWFWVALWIYAEFSGWVNSAAFISRLSLVALILGSWSAEEAAKVEVKSEEKEATSQSPTNEGESDNGDRRHLSTDHSGTADRLPGSESLTKEDHS